MTTSAPYNVCNGSQATGVSTTFTVTVGTGTGSPQGAAVGDLVYVEVGVAGATTINSFADSKGNVYVPQEFVSTGQQQNAIYASIITRALVSGTDTFTATFSSTTGAKFIIAKGASGIATATADKINAASNVGSTAPNSGSSGVLSQASELVVGCFQYGAATLSAPSFGSALTVTSSSSLTEINKIVSATTAQTASATLSVSVPWAALIATFPISLPVIATNVLPNGAPGVAYNQSVVTNGGLPTFTYAITAGSLTGSGLTLSSAGVISGTGAAPGVYSFTVQVTDGNGNTASKALSITIAIAYPKAILDLQTDLNLGGNWTGITGDVYSEQSKPKITRGRTDESAQATPSALTCWLDNRLGNYSPRNPAGANYGKLGKNTPIRMHVPEGGTYLRLEDDNASNASCPSSATINLTNDLEARIDLNLSNFSPTVLAFKWSTSAGNFSWAWLLNGDGTLAFWYSTTGSNINTVTSTAPMPWPGGRVTLKVTYNATNAAVNFYYSTSPGGSFTQIGNTVTGPISGTLFAGTTVLRVGQIAGQYFNTLNGYQASLPYTPGKTFAPAAYNSITGKVYEFQLRSGIGGPLVANPVFSVQGVGATSFSDGQGNTWTINGTATLTNRKFRFHGEVPAWPPRWDPSGANVYVPLTANGLLRRIQQSGTGSQPPLDSAMTRAWKQKTGVYAPVAYWPVEDPTGASQIASGLPGGTPMNFQGKASGGGGSLGSSSPFACTSALAVPGTKTWTGYVPPQLPSVAAWSVQFLVSVPSGGETNNVVLARVHVWAGQFTQIDLRYTTGGGIAIDVVDNNGTATNSIVTYAPNLNGSPMLVQVAADVEGGTYNLYTNFLAPGQTPAGSASIGTGTGPAGHVRRVIVNPTQLNMQSGIGQIAVQSAFSAINSTAPAADPVLGPLNAFAGETAANRFARLCGEQGMTYRIVGYPYTSAPMGAQLQETLMQLLQECEDADNGMIFEPRQAFALGYRTSASMTSQAQAVAGAQPLTLSYTGAQLGGGGGMDIEPTDDDAFLTNDVIGVRTTGSSIDLAETAAKYSAITSLSAVTGGYNNASPPAGAGDYQSTKTINTFTDDQLRDATGWLVHLGSVNEPRYPSIPVDLARSAVQTVANAIQDLDLGDYLQISPTASPLPPDAVKALMWGTTEVLGGFIYTIEWQTRPESPFETLIAGTGATSDMRADTDGSTLNASILTGTTSLLVVTAAGFPLWTTTAGDFPFDIIIGGERMTVTNITGTSGAQTFTVTRAVNGVVKAHSPGEAVSLFQPVYLAVV